MPKKIRKKKTVVFGLLGTVLDVGFRASKRWQKWRPTVSIFQHEDFKVDRMELIYPPDYDRGTNQVKNDILSVSPDSTLNLHGIPVRDPWDFEEVYGTLLDFVQGYPFDTEKEDYLVHITTGTHVAQICWFLLAESHYLPAKILQTAPPPQERKGEIPGTYAIIDLDLSKYDEIAQRFHLQAQDDTSFLKSGIATQNNAFNSMIDRLERVAIRSKAPILLTGPTGAGKSQLAQRIYELKKNQHTISGEFVPVNCATLRGDGAMSALFGHVKGAFTGALQDRPGLLKKANGGILFLDEVGDLGLDEQAMLLRAIEYKRFLPLGADSESSSEFQLICGTNRELGQDVSERRFREDLLARINLWSFDLPGLAERPEDIEPNLEYELEQYAVHVGSRVNFNREARKRFLEFGTGADGLWAGNFRDLNAAVVRMATLSESGRITDEIVKDEIGRLRNLWSSFSSPSVLSTESDELLEGREIDEFDRVQLTHVLRICRGCSSLSQAGRTLFQMSRLKKKTPNDADRLRKYLAKFDLMWEDIQE